MSEEKSLMDKVISGEEIDQFQLLEEKIDSLIDLVSSLKKDKEALIHNYIVRNLSFKKTKWPTLLSNSENQRQPRIWPNKGFPVY